MQFENLAICILIFHTSDIMIILDTHTTTILYHYVTLGNVAQGASSFVIRWSSGGKSSFLSKIVLYASSPGWN